jgi:hypothetical protein
MRETLNPERPSVAMGIGAAAVARLAVAAAPAWMNSRLFIPVISWLKQLDLSIE